MCNSYIISSYVYLSMYTISSWSLFFLIFNSSVISPLWLPRTYNRYFWLFLPFLSTKFFFSTCFTSELKPFWDLSSKISLNLMTLSRSNPFPSVEIEKLLFWKVMLKTEIVVFDICCCQHPMTYKVNWVRKWESIQLFVKSNNQCFLWSSLRFSIRMSSCLFTC